MSEQANTQVTTNGRRDRQTRKPNSSTPQVLQRPANDDREAWKTYWGAQDQLWRTEPEVDSERQKYLAERRAIVPDVQKGIYSFREIKLSRADIEWLLATHENGRGPVDWNDLGQRKRQGLDLYGVDLRGVDLSRLPLANAYFFKAHLEEARFRDAHLEGANFVHAHLKRADLIGAYLRDAFLADAHLEKAVLIATHLEGALLMEAHLQGANLLGSHFDTETRLDSITLFNQEKGGVVLADVHWGDVNLTVVDWSALSILGDELVVILGDKSVALYGSDSPADTQIKLGYLKRATRAYRQLAVVLRNQGLNEDAARFAYRAQLMQRKVFWYQRKFGQYLFSLFLDLLAGYGYKPIRSFIAYLIVIATFATTYFIIGLTAGPILSPLGSIVFSMTSFHGRGFFPGGIGLDDPLTVVAALEAFVGLLIEVTFIATLTQRLFGK